MGGGEISSISTTRRSGDRTKPLATSRWLQVEESKRSQDWAVTADTVVGIGCVFEIDPKSKLPVIRQILPRSPAAFLPALKAGFFVVKVEEVATSGLGLAEIVSRIRGVEGTKVTLAVAETPTGAAKAITIVRKRIDSLDEKSASDSNGKSTASPPAESPSDEEKAREMILGLLSREKLAPLSDPIMCHVLAVAYQDGFVVDASDTKAFELFSRAAAQGYAASQSKIGQAFMEGHGVFKDFAKAAEWFKKAADQGQPEASAHYGIMLWNGEGLERDRRQAVRWLQTAARKGNRGATEMIADCYRDGSTLKQDVARANQWRATAAKGKVPEDDSVIFPTPDVSRDKLVELTAKVDRIEADYNALTKADLSAYKSYITALTEVIEQLHTDSWPVAHQYAKTYFIAAFITRASADLMKSPQDRVRMLSQAQDFFRKVLLDGIGFSEKIKQEDPVRLARAHATFAAIDVQIGAENNISPAAMNESLKDASESWVLARSLAKSKPSQLASVYRSEGSSYLLLIRYGYDIGDGANIAKSRFQSAIDLFKQRKEAKDQLLAARCWLEKAELSGRQFDATKSRRPGHPLLDEVATSLYQARKTIYDVDPHHPMMDEVREIERSLLRVKTQDEGILGELLWRSWGR